MFLKNSLYCTQIKTAFTAFVFLLLAAGCAHQHTAGGPVKLTRAQFIGHTLNLISDTQVEWYSFGDNGIVLATVGDKEAATSPAFYWKLADNHTLLITDQPDGKDSPSAKNTVSIPLQFKALTQTNAVAMDGRIFKRELTPR